MTTRFDIEQRWPDVFDGLIETQRWSVVQSLAAAWGEGWEPNRADVVNLTEFAGGRIDHAEYIRRSNDADGLALFGMVAVFAQLRVDTIRENTMHGLAHARAQGRVGGRRSKMTPEKIARAQRMRAENRGFDQSDGTVELRDCRRCSRRHGTHTRR